jgi:hypothetical protein
LLFFDALSRISLRSFTLAWRRLAQQVPNRAHLQLYQSSRGFAHRSRGHWQLAWSRRRTCEAAHHLCFLLKLASGLFHLVFGTSSQIWTVYGDCPICSIRDLVEIEDFESVSRLHSRCVCHLFPLVNPQGWDFCVFILSHFGRPGLYGHTCPCLVYACRDCHMSGCLGYSSS